MKLVLLSGSFRSKSRCMFILESIKKYYPKNEYYLPKLDFLPFYCQDLAKSEPEEVSKLVDEISKASGIVVCSPEYNHSIPAVLKNAIDWASRPAFNSVLRKKPVTIITQATSSVGGARAQAHIKLIFDSALSSIHPAREMMIPNIDTVIDPDGKIVDPKVEERLIAHMSNFMYFVERQRA